MGLHVKAPLCYYLSWHQAPGESTGIYKRCLCLGCRGRPVLICYDDAIILDRPSA